MFCIPNLLGIVLPLLVVGIFWWLFDAYVPCKEPIKKIITIVVVVIVVVWVLNQFCLLGNLTTIGGGTVKR